MIAALPLLALAFAAAPAGAVDCSGISHAGAEFTVCEVDAGTDALRLFLKDPQSGEPLGGFSGVERVVSREGLSLRFAMNAGMFHPDLSPVGLYIENGESVMRAVSSAGPGNFGMLPNGVLCIGDGWTRVYETLRYLDERPACRHATQSGPMLVIDGKLHPRFSADSRSFHVRNGVGTSTDGRTAWFAVSSRPVNFHTFARLFRDVLEAPSALYLDGGVSRLYAPQIGRRDAGGRIGPIIGVVGEAR